MEETITKIAEKQGTQNRHLTGIYNGFSLVRWWTRTVRVRELKIYNHMRKGSDKHCLLSDRQVKPCRVQGWFAWDWCDSWMLWELCVEVRIISSGPAEFQLTCFWKRIESCWCGVAWVTSIFCICNNALCLGRGEVAFAVTVLWKLEFPSLFYCLWQEEQWQQQFEVA